MGRLELATVVERILHAMDLDETLRQFDRVEANLERLERVWERLHAMVPTGLEFFDVGSPQQKQYEELRRAFGDLAEGIPPIDGKRIDERPRPLNEISSDRLDAREIGEFGAELAVEEDWQRPGVEIADYKHAFRRAGSQLVRDRVQHLSDAIDNDLRDLVGRIEPSSDLVYDGLWEKVGANISEVLRLVGNSVQRTGRWTELARHLSFGQGVDLHDVANSDWPSVKGDIEASLYSDTEPLPVELGDLGDLVRAKPTGAVATELSWDSLSPDDFERLIYNILKSAPDYENAQWLMKTSAADRGRDLSVERVRSDALTGVVRDRVIIQCKHWQSRSVAPSDLSNAIAAVLLWEPPPVELLIVVTSGRFSADAVTGRQAQQRAKETAARTVARVASRITARGKAVDR